MRSYPFCLELEVRDYECDMQGHVNNAVYLNYLEHCRHQFLKARGLDFAEITKSGLNLVVVRAEVDYKRSLKSGERFVIGLRMERVSRLRFQFIQEIFLLPEKRTALKATILCSGVNSMGRPELPKEILEALESPGA